MSSRLLPASGHRRSSHENVHWAYRGSVTFSGRRVSQALRLTRHIGTIREGFGACGASLVGLRPESFGAPIDPNVCEVGGAADAYYGASWIVSDLLRHASREDACPACVEISRGLWFMEMDDIAWDRAVAYQRSIYRNYKP